MTAVVGVVGVVVVVVGGWVGGRLGTVTMAWKGHHRRETRVGEQRRMIWTWIFAVCLTNWSLPFQDFFFPSRVLVTLTASTSSVGIAHHAKSKSIPGVVHLSLASAVDGS